MEELLEKKFKAFVKLPCAQCGKAACKRFASSMPLVVKTMLDAFWCKDCGRLLCEAHRDAHTCEKLEALKEARAAMAPEKIRAQLEEEKRQKAAAEEAAKAPQREATKAADERRQRRYMLAEKAWHVSNFMQTAARDEQAERTQDITKELLDLYTKTSRISTLLWNEYEKPTLSGLAEDEWSELKRLYARGVEILGVVVAVPKNGNWEGGEWEELDMTNPWERPSAAPAKPPQRVAVAEPAAPAPRPPAEAPAPAAASSSASSAGGSSASGRAAGPPLLALPRPAQQRPAPPEGYQGRLGVAGRLTANPLLNFTARPLGGLGPTLLSRPGSRPTATPTPGGGLAGRGGGAGLAGRGAGAGLGAGVAPGRFGKGRGGAGAGAYPPGSLAGGKGPGKGSTAGRTLGVLSNRGLIGRGLGKGGGSGSRP